MAFGIDYAWGYPGIPALREAGVKFVCRYLSRDPSKNLCRVAPSVYTLGRPSEARELRGADIDIVVVWETTAGRALAGFDAGLSDAKEAHRQLVACGGPFNAPIYFAIDFDATTGQQAPINSYFRGVNSAIGLARTGAYGGYWPLGRLFDSGLIKYGWQTYAWSGGRWDKRAQLQQYSNGHRVGGVACDYDRTTAADFGQWGGQKPSSGKPAPPAPLPGRWGWKDLIAFLKRGGWHR